MRYITLTFFNGSSLLISLALQAMNFWTRHIILLIVLNCYAFIGLAQQEQPKLVQFSGIIKNTVTNEIVPYVSIQNISYNNEFHAANHQGFFSFVAHPGDTIVLSSIGFRTAEIIVPDIEDSRYTALIKMTADAIQLPAVRLLPWASVEEFNLAFMALDVADDDYLLAKKNLSRQSLDALARTVPLSAGEIYNINSSIRHTEMSNQSLNQRMSNPLLNPFAWGKFIDHIRQGKESRKRY